MSITNTWGFFLHRRSTKKTNPYVSTIKAAFQVVQFRRRVSELYFQMDTIIFQNPHFYYILLHSAASGLGLHCLSMSHKKDARLIWVKIHY